MDASIQADLAVDLEADCIACINRVEYIFLCYHNILDSKIEYWEAGPPVCRIKKC